MVQAGRLETSRRWVVMNFLYLIVLILLVIILVGLVV